MKRIIRFLRYRKQHDSIKVAILLFIVAVYYLIDLISQGIQYYKMINTPVEYIMEMNSSVASIDSKLELLNDVDGVVAASPQKSYSISISKDDEERYITVTKLSKQYFISAYGLKESQLSDAIYMNKNDFTDIFGNKKNNTVLSKYKIEENQTKNATFKYLEGITPSYDNALCMAYSSELSNDVTKLRVMCSNVNINNKTVSKIESLGFMIINKEQLVMESYEQKILLQKLRYSIVIIILGFSFGTVLIKRG